MKKKSIFSKNSRPLIYDCTYIMSTILLEKMIRTYEKNCVSFNLILKDL